jgi:uncharacterized integral membrane protein
MIFIIAAFFLGAVIVVSVGVTSLIQMGREDGRRRTTERKH